MPRLIRSLLESTSSIDEDIALISKDATLSFDLEHPFACRFVPFSRGDLMIETHESFCIVLCCCPLDIFQDLCRSRIVVRPCWVWLERVAIIMRRNIALTPRIPLHVSCATTDAQYFTCSQAMCPPYRGSSHISQTHSQDLASFGLLLLPSSVRHIQHPCILF